MRTPDALITLVEYGIVEEVLRPLMSGKEAQIYLVRSGGELRVAKIYKDAQHRSFKQRSEYTEGRATRNSRDRRAMAKHTRHGREQDEAAWRSAEVNAIYRLSAAGVRVPVPYHFVDGVLVMELVRDHEGQPAPRLGDLEYTPAVAQQIFDHLLATVVRMLCAGVVHGDLSEFNVLMAADGPVVIDFPQAVDPASNQSARKLLLRDVDNLQRFLARHVRGLRAPPYAQEMWELYQQSALTPETQLRGRLTATNRRVDTTDVLALIGDAEREHRRRGGPPAPRGPKVEVLVRGRGAVGPAPQRATPTAGSPPAQGAPNRERRRPEARRDGAPQEAPREARPQAAAPREARPQAAAPREARPQAAAPREARPQAAAPREARPQAAAPRQDEPAARPPTEDAGPPKRRRRRRSRGAATRPSPTPGV